MKYLNIKKALPYSRTFNIFIGGRGIGKTFSTKKYIIEQFKKNNAPSVWIKETSEQIKKLLNNNGALFYEKIKDIEPKLFENAKITRKANVLFWNKKPFIYFLALSEFADIKGNDFPEVKTIIFDEFIKEKNQIVRVDRAYAFISILESVTRLNNNYKVFLLSNSITKSDEILDLFNIDFNFNEYKTYQNKSTDAILFYEKNSEEFNKARQQNKLNALDYKPAKRVNLNVFNNDDFLIEDTPKKLLSPIFKIIYNDLHICFNSSKRGFYVNINDKENIITYSKEKQKNAYIISNEVIKLVTSAWANDSIRFYNNKILTYFKIFFNLK